MMDTQQNYQHWRLQSDAERILWLTLDRQGTSVNSLNQEVISELESILNALKPKETAGLVILSGKSKGFIAGADIKQFVGIKDAEEAYTLVRQVQKVFDRINDLPLPSVALIRGFCLGGGLELALACRYRIAEDSPSTVLGLPEVKLGLHPGWGGTVRLPRLIGSVAAMKMMLTGQPVSAAKAKKLGLVDEAVAERYLEKAARYYVLKAPRRHQSMGIRWSNASLVRPVLTRILNKNLEKIVRKDHYPAPFAILENWERDGGKGEAAKIQEARSISRLMMGSTSRELIRAFFLQEQLKAFAKSSSFKPLNVHVIGAGVMGGDIAAWCAYKGFRVTLQDQNAEKIAPAMGRAWRLLTHKIETGRLARAAFDRLEPDPSGYGVPKADIIIEAVFENLQVKQDIFKDLEERAYPSAILATNTSSIPLQEIALVMKNPERLIGLHFFNPVAKMNLVEIIYSAVHSAEKLADAASFVNQLGHFPLPVLSSPGFLVNRILMPYLLEAMTLYEEGAPIAAIDFAAKNFGMPMGPIELADKVGLDICLSVAEHLAGVYGFQIPKKLFEKVEKKNLGIKSGKGFYRYNRDGQPIVHKTVFPAPDMTDRLILRLCNEAVACWGEKLVANADLIDAGMIYGVGFAPFRGGPMEYIRQSGAKALQDKLLEFSEKYGDRFKPSSPWEELISS
jgi:3-hydroxyacyl-CoA dehydrogenase/enoyl-CoA hydratase/3-hydroxybutyryl-CoA epimerase